MENTYNTIPASLREKIEGYKLKAAEHLKTWFTANNLDLDYLPQIMTDLTDFLEYRQPTRRVTDEATKIIKEAAVNSKQAQDPKYKFNSPTLALLIKAYENIANFLTYIGNKEKTEEELENIVKSFTPLEKQILITEGAIEITGGELLTLNLSSYFLIFIIWASELNATEEELLCIKPKGVEGLNLSEDYIRNAAKIALSAAAELRVKYDLPIKLDLNKLPDNELSTLWEEDKNTQKYVVNEAATGTLRLWQTITNTLKKHMELFPIGTLPFLGNKILYLKEAIDKFNDKYLEDGAEELNEEMVYYTLFGLFDIVQNRGVEYQTELDKIKWHQYKINITDFTRIATLIPQPSAPYISKIWQSLYFLSTFNIKAEEKIFVATDKTGKKHYKTEEIWVPFIRTSSIKTYKRSEEELPYNLEIVIDINNYVKTGRRDTIIVEGKKTREIQQPTDHIITKEEERVAKNIFPRAEGRRFYLTLLSGNHMEENKLLENIFSYDKPKNIRVDIEDKDYEEKIKEEDKRLKQNLARNKRRHKKKIEEWFREGKEEGLLLYYSRERSKNTKQFIWKWERNNFAENFKEIL